MQKILFLRKFKRGSGGQIKVRDYFMHCLHHPELDPYLYFTLDSTYQNHELWAEVPKEKIVSEIQIELYDVIFVTGKDWKFLPKAIPGKKVIHFLQVINQFDKNHPAFRCLKRPAFRICVSLEIYAASAPYIVGEAVVIKNGIPLDLFSASKEKRNNSILIWARKNPSLGTGLCEELKRRGLDVTLLIDSLPRAEFARRLGESDIFVALPYEREACYLPALEGMASRCAVICSGVVGTWSYAIHGQTCLMPKYDHYGDHLTMIEQLLADHELREKIRQQGFEMAQSFSLETERVEFYRFLEKFILA